VAFSGHIDIYSVSEAAVGLYNRRCPSVLQLKMRHRFYLTHYDVAVTDEKL